MQYSKKPWAWVALALLSFSCQTEAAPTQPNPQPKYVEETDAAPFSVQVDWLYLQTRLSNNIFARVAPTATATAPAIKSKRPNLKPKYQSGFRITAEYDISTDYSWGIKTAYTHFASHDKKELSKPDDKNLQSLLRVDPNSNVVTNSSEFNVPGNPAMNNNGNLTRAKEDFKTKLNLVDIELGKTFIPVKSKALTIRPFAGIRWAHIHQNVTVEYSQPFTPAASTPFNATETTTYLRRAQDIGLKFGGNTFFSFFQDVNSGLGAYADFALSLLIAEVKTSTAVNWDNDAINSLVATKTLNTFKNAGFIGIGSTKTYTSHQVADLGLGLSWHLFMNDKHSTKLEIHAGWEAQRWDALGAINQGNLFYHGFKLGAKIDF